MRGLWHYGGMTNRLAHSFLRTFYTVFHGSLLPFLLLRLVLRSRKLPDYRYHLAERLGFYKTYEQPCIWVHAVSVGEVLAAEALIGALESIGANRVHLTVMTPTGRAIAQKRLPKVAVSYIPYDIPSLQKRFIKRIKPKFLMLMERELWPNLLHTCQRASIPVVLANGRLSKKSLRRYLWIKSQSRIMCQQLSLVLAQTRSDWKRFLKLGVAPNQAHVAGNLKFDKQIEAEVLTKAKHIRAEIGEDKLIIVAGSTHAGEEQALLDAFNKLKILFTNLVLILVPRHPPRFDDVYQLAASNAQKVARISDPDWNEQEASVLILDKMGQLLSYYAACDLAFVGGSLIPHGGQNPLEPAQFGKAIITGPHMFNFEYMYKALSNCGALVSASDENALETITTSLLSDDKKRAEMGQIAKSWLDKNHGALKRHLAYLAPYVDAKLNEASR